MTLSKWIGWTIAALMATAAALQFWLLDGIQGEIASWTLGEHTEYSAGYSDEGFRRIEPGMSSEEVIRLIGEPLSRGQLQDGREAWRYAWSPTDSSYRVRAMVMEAGKVVSVSHEFYVD